MKSKIWYFEWARVLAAVAVVFLHVLVSTTVSNDVATLGVPFALTYAELQLPLTRWAVPVFLMISGALLLNPAKEISFAKIGRYVGRMAFVLATFGLLYCLMESVFVLGLSWASVGDAVLSLLSGQSWDHMWYVYALIGLYLLTPPLKTFVAASSRRQLEIALAVLFALTLVVPTANSLLGTSLVTLVWVSFAVFYYLFGHYAHTYLQFSWKIAVAGIAAILLSMAGTAWYVTQLGDYAAFLCDPSCFLVAIYSAAVFLAFKRFCDRPAKEGGVVTTLSSYSFGIYIVHPLFLNILFKVLGWMPGVTMPLVVFELVVFAIALAASIALVWVLKRLPEFRRMI